MNKYPFYSIGEFAKKTGMTVRTLHYYDEIGLLKPKKDSNSGRRLYSDQDILTLQKIVSLKFLGYSLEQIKKMLYEMNMDLNLKETLQFQQKLFEEKKEQIETVLKAIKRTLAVLEEEEHVDSTVLMSLIHSIQTEKVQRQLVEQYTSKEIAEKLFDQPEEEVIEFDKVYVQLSNEVKKLAGRPFQDPEVLALMEKYLKVTYEFIGEEAMNFFSKLDEDKIQAFNDYVLSPFTQEEEKWLQEAMDYYTIKIGLYQPIDEHNEGNADFCRKKNE